MTTKMSRKKDGLQLEHKQEIIHQNHSRYKWIQSIRILGRKKSMQLLLGANVYDSFKKYSKNKIQYTFISDFFLTRLISQSFPICRFVSDPRVPIPSFLGLYFTHLGFFFFLYRYWHLMGGGWKLSTMLRCYQVFSARKFIFNK